MDRSLPRTTPPAVDVLLIEDDEVACVLISQDVRTRELAVDVAADVTEAKRLLSRNHYKVALIDLVLLDGSGIEIIDFIRESNLIDLHAVVITAAEPSSLPPLDRSVVKEVFFKPLQIDRLGAYVQSHAK